MPFTFSHPALVLPLSKVSGKWLSLTGLVVGSVVPDFEYFIRMRIQSSISHTFGGLFWFDVPLGVLLTFAFHNIVRNRLYDNLPRILRQRVATYKSFNWNQYFKQHWLIVILSVLIGAMSHLFWDAFTHSHGYFVQLFPALRIYAGIVVMGSSIPYYRILQHVSTLIGAAVIGTVILRMPVVDDGGKPGNPKYWWVVSIIVVIIVILRFMIGIGQNLAGQLAGTIISAGLIALMATPFIVDEKIKIHDIR